VWRITWRGVATVKAAYNILDDAQCFDVWRQRARTFLPRVAAKRRAVNHYVVNVAVTTAIQKSRNIMNSSNYFCINESIYECKYKDLIDIWWFSYEKQLDCLVRVKPFGLHTL
jgi:hypothetical protein